MNNDEDGILFLVSTPIGNLDDMTKRAVDTLKKSDIIACEDTRRTARLLKRYGIDKPLESYHDHNKEKKTPYFLKLLGKGKMISLVSDSGTPCISDPGFYLVKNTIEKGFRLLPLPGASALLSALIVSGLATDRFVFEGFLPKKKGRRGKRLEQLKEEERTIILFESPFRLLSLLTGLYEIFGDRKASISRELTKMYEETIRGTLSELITHFSNKKPKGEFVIVVEGAKR
ncbi:MAG: 16S rRNA (cytidine(1402)-2'-O)-methyltransferase [Candidatus Cloacimonadota bacterium]|nr:MAG: 16S rRNA (cytidine(1402)-2'-O)-methyltransferase [Candidatus Cloacimonadota bacterium]